MPTLNLGILAHVDAGKTTLTERLLYETGATRHLGRVDHGDTTTDSDSIERRRGITIRTAVATMTLPSPHGPVKVNLIDTPGHSDFVATAVRMVMPRRRSIESESVVVSPWSTRPRCRVAPVS